MGFQFSQGKDQVFCALGGIDGKKGLYLLVEDPANLGEFVVFSAGEVIEC